MPVFAWCTHLHLDHTSPESREKVAQQLRNMQGEVVILTGDVSNSKRLTADLRWLAAAAAPPFYFVLGNHDHYGSSIASVRDAMISLAAEPDAPQWLPPAAVISLSSSTALIGVDGWADGRHGEPLHTPLVLNDDRFIAELAAQPTRAAKLAVKQALADADAARLAVLLDRAAVDHQKIIMATHVPPFVEALPTSGHLASSNWWPLLVSGATGEVIKRFASEHPTHQMLVLAGHSHAETDSQILPNLRCRVGSARYGSPAVRELDWP